jgi:formate hydrogenlyase subunit 3/multisubunit Na+/H+ antiporter MnhD subunit
VGLASLGLLLACGAAPATRRLVAPLAVAGALAVAGVLAAAPLVRMGLLEAAAVVALVVLWGTARGAARRGYLAAVALSAIGMVGGAVAAGRGHPQLALVLLLPGVAVKLGLVPLWCWLPLVAEATPAVVAGLVVGVVDVAAFGELLALRGAEPWLFEPALPWLALGVATAIVGALLTLAQRDLKRLLAFSTIEDMGLLVAALVLGGEYGVGGAALGAAVHALAKALLFASVAGPEAEGAAVRDPRGLATGHPLAAFGFLLGALSVLGVPPTLGYAAHWRIFVALAGRPPLLAALAGAAMLAVATYARAIALFWWGGGDSAQPPQAYSRRVLGAGVVLLAAALVVLGLWPGLLGGVA